MLKVRLRLRWATWVLPVQYLDVSSLGQLGIFHYYQIQYFTMEDRVSVGPNKWSVPLPLLLHSVDLVPVVGCFLYTCDARTRLVRITRIWHALPYGAPSVPYFE
jgi:hypothetical protein